MQIKEPIRLIVVAGICFGLAPVLKAQDAEKRPAPRAEQPTTNPEKKPLAGPTQNSAKDPANKKGKPAPKQITGAEIYSMHCARCHPERYPNERTSAQWKTIALHMRVRANLPAEQVRKVVKYLQDNSGY